MKKNIIFILSLFLVGPAYGKSFDIALCAFATGKYSSFVKKFIESADKYFLRNHNVHYYIFTDQNIVIDNPRLHIIKWPHKDWPFSTMMRFEGYRKNIHLFKGMDYVFSSDIDMEFVCDIEDCILGSSVGVLHPGYYGKNIANNLEIFEKNIISKAFFKPSEIKNYFAGGFYGGDLENFKKTIEHCCRSVDQDLKRNIIACWHDETHLNRYFLNNPPSVKLLPSYCYPEELLGEKLNSPLVNNYKNISYMLPKLIALDKKDINLDNASKKENNNFVILIPSYNNIKYYKKCLDSVYSQNYSNYRVVYIDDNSPDGTGQAVKDYVRLLGKEDITKVVRNKDRVLAMANIYYGIYNYCSNNEIVVMLDGDDCLANDKVLSYVNSIYKTKNIWMTYGNCSFKESNMVSSYSCKLSGIDIEKNMFREKLKNVAHLKTFYAWLFKKINKNDLMMDGTFLKATYDVAMYMPMLEMSGFRHAFIEKTLYYYNDCNPINDHKVNHDHQIKLDRIIRTKLHKYSPVTN
jgi:histo-blood group ABO system transferase